LDLRGKQ